MRKVKLLCSIHLCWLVAGISLDVRFIQAFSCQPRTSPHAKSRIPTRLFQADLRAGPERTTGSFVPSSGKTALHFRADYTYTSKPFPKTVARQDLADFLLRTTTRDIFITAGGTRTGQEFPLDEYLKERWIAACKHFGSTAYPSAGDKVVAANSATNLIGVVVTNRVFSGVKAINTDTDSPEYDCFLLAEQRTTQGSGPMLWLHRKLIGSDEFDERGYSPSLGMSRSRVSIITRKDGSLALHWKCNLEIIVEFPSILCKILPISQKQLEERGSAAILGVISKDIRNAVDVARDVYQKEEKIHSVTQKEEYRYS